MEVSVVIPFYNSEATLARAIDSVLAQEDVELQILLIDNNSTDRSPEIASVYRDKHKQISLHKERQQGANHARNLGLSLSTNEWIQYLDADDALLPQKIANQLSIQNLEEIDVISSPIIEQTTQGKTIHYEVDDMGDLWIALLQGKIGWTCSNLWRKSALVNVGGWNLDYTSHQEVELMSRLIMKRKNFYFYNKAECIVYEQESSISHSTHFPLTGIALMKHLQYYFKTNDIFSDERKKAIHTQLYHKSLMAFKADSKKAKEVLKEVWIDTSSIELPTLHNILIRLIGMQNTFRVLKTLGGK